MFEVRGVSVNGKRHRTNIANTNQH